MAEALSQLGHLLVVLPLLLLSTPPSSSQVLLAEYLHDLLGRGGGRGGGGLAALPVLLLVTSSSSSSPAPPHPSALEEGTIRLGQRKKTVEFLLLQSPHLEVTNSRKWLGTWNEFLSPDQTQKKLDDVWSRKVKKNRTEIDDSQISFFSYLTLPACAGAAVILTLLHSSSTVHTHFKPGSCVTKNDFTKGHKSDPRHQENLRDTARDKVH